MHNIFFFQKIMFSNSPSASYPHPSQVHPSGIVRPNTTHHNHQVFPSNNPFKGTFADEDEANDLIGLENGQRSIYEEQLLQDEARLTELKMRRDQVKDNAEASQQLEKDINDLNQIMQDLSQLVHEQHDMVDSIEDHVEQTMHEVQAGERHLRRAVATQSAKYPIAAAAVGGVAAGGPVGIVAGSAIAGIAAAVGGAFAGLYGGKFLKKQAQKQTAGPPPTT